MPKPIYTKEQLAIIKEAKNTHKGDNELSFDPLPKLAKAEGGTWVSAWVWVSAPDPENETASR